MEPDLAGFADAQRRLRDKFGRVVTFFTPVASTYDPSVQLDENGEPFDPTIEPLASGYASAVVKANRVLKPLAGVTNETHSDQLGTGSRLNQQLIVDILAIDGVRDADFYELDGERWTVTDVVTDGIGAEQRVVVYSKRGAQ